MLVAALSLLVVALSLGLPGLVTPAFTADDSKVKGATQRVEQGAKKIGEGEVVDGTKETAKGVGQTVVEGAKYTGEKLKESGQAAEPKAKSAWENTRDGAVAFGQSVKKFFTSLFSN
jgi:hypothetical protein